MPHRKLTDAQIKSSSLGPICGLLQDGSGANVVGQTDSPLPKRIGCCGHGDCSVVGIIFKSSVGHKSRMGHCEAFLLTLIA